MKSPVKLFAALAILLATATVTAQVYRWVDKDGKVQYSDVPPGDAGKGDVKSIKTPPPSSPPSSTTTKSNPNAEKAGDSTAEKKETEKKPEEDERVKKQWEERCKAATFNLQELESGRPIIRNNNEGNRVYVSDTEREEEIQRLRRIVAESCKQG